jgi:KDO2-lipid IV(A) lauroyltransferase
VSDERKPTLSHRVEHGAFMGVLHLSKLLGPKLSNAFGGAVGTLGYFPLRFRRSLVERHLRMAFPEKDDAWIQQTARAAYAHLGRESLSAIRLRGYDPRAADRDHFDAEPECSRESARARQRRYSGERSRRQSGNHRGIRGSTRTAAGRRRAADNTIRFSMRPSTRLVNAWVCMSSTALMPRSSSRNHSAKNHIVGFAADQNAGKAGIFIPFFGHLASTHRGAALFAVKAGAPLVLVMALRKGEGYEVLVEEVDVDRNGPVDDVVYRLTVAFTKRLEEVVRMHPGPVSLASQAVENTPARGTPHRQTGIEIRDLFLYSGAQ